jgi:hypothetical protein
MATPTGPTFYFTAATTSSNQHNEIISPVATKKERTTLSGKKQAGPRRISSVWDNVDQKIFDLKNQGFSNKDVAANIKRLGVDYDPKTIGTRYLRLKAHAASVEKQGEDPEHDWSLEQDAALFTAFETASDMQLERIARAKAKFWGDCYEQAGKLTDISKVPKDKFQERYAFLMGDDLVGHRADVVAFATRIRNNEINLPLTPSTASSISTVFGLPSPVTGPEDGHHFAGIDVTSGAKAYVEPRSKMLTTELDRELKVRKLSRAGRKEELVRRLREDDESVSEEVLQARLRKRNLPTDGSRDELIHRIVQSDVTGCEWGKRVAEVTLEEVEHRIAVAPSKRVENRKRALDCGEEPAEKRRATTGAVVLE